MKKIHYTKENKYFSKLAPAASVLPSWYKSAPKSPDHARPYAGGFKSCAPFLDSLISGYVLTTQCEIYVEHGVDGPLFSWKSEWNPVSARPNETVDGLLVPEEYSPNGFAWWTDYSIKLPRGYSLLVTHPLNRSDLPFFTTSGIVDADSLMVRGHLPFFIRKDFSGIIPVGTPYAQLIPIKRETWEASESDDLREEVSTVLFKMSQLLSGYYKKTSWIKKRYR